VNVVPDATDCSPVGLDDYLDAFPIAFVRIASDTGAEALDLSRNRIERVELPVFDLVFVDFVWLGLSSKW
jgi:hypothetical protein